MGNFKYWSIIFKNYSDIKHASLFEDNIERFNYHTDVIDEVDLKVSKNIFIFISTIKNEINHIELTEMLNEIGVKVSLNSVRLKLSRGNFKVQFFIDCLKAMDVDTLYLKQ